MYKITILVKNIKK